MRLVLVWLLLGSALAAVPRVKRQKDGAPWWKPSAATTSSATIDKDVLEAIFGTSSVKTTTTTEDPESGVRVGAQGGGSALTPSNTEQEFGSNPSHSGLPQTNSASPALSPGTAGIAGDKSCRFQCVPYYLCRDGEIVTDGTGIIDIRTGPGSDVHNRTLVGGNCPGYIEVCCRDPNATPPPTEAPIPYTAQCGHRNPDGVFARISGFKEGEAQFGEFPWMAAILRVEKVADQQQQEYEVNLYQCGGSLIERDVVLTAAHCVSGKHPDELKVRLGEWDTQRQDELLPYQDIYVSAVVIHERYYSGALFNDVALLFLQAPARLAPNVDTVCLPPAEWDFSGSRCWATGWGKDKYDKSGSYQNILKEIDLPVVSRYDCEQSLRKTRLGSWYRLHESFLCAGGEPGKDTCKGDGGGPLVCEDPEDPRRYVQVGIVAWGIGCGEDGTPGVYANVIHLLEWIKQNIRQTYDQ